MFVNVTKSRLVIGRFSVLPGEKVPAVTMTAKENAGVQHFLKKGYLVEKPNVHKSEAVPQKEVNEKVAKAAEKKPVEAKPADKPVEAKPSEAKPEEKK